MSNEVRRLEDAVTDRLPDVHFGDVEDDELPPESDLDEADDDEELAVTPTDVVELLGFDPLELEDVTADELTLDDFKESDHPRDREGKFYHGTGAEFKKFEKKPSFRPNTSLGGFSFTTDPRSASSYAVSSARATGGRPRVISASLNFQNPLDITDVIKRLRRRGMSFGEAKKKAIEGFDPAKHDALVFRGNAQNPDEYTVFRPEQIKITNDFTTDDLTWEEGKHPRDREGKFARAGRAVAGRVRQRASSIGAALRELSGEQREKLKEHFERGSEDRNQAVRHLRNAASLPASVFLHSLGEEAHKVAGAAQALRALRGGDYDPEHLTRATELGTSLANSLMLSAAGGPEEFLAHVVHHVVVEHAVKWAAAGGTLMHEHVRESVTKRQEARRKLEETTSRRVGEIAQKYRGYTGDDLKDAELTDVEVVQEFLRDVADALETKTVDELLSDRNDDALAHDAGLI
ncbi:MAG: hypothetical protein KGO96_10090 [Elusimicrobia bacterium]|nr:hypothetical protein [Elusimicrobiota bacterium]